MTDWDEFIKGMEKCRKSGDPGYQSTTKEMLEVGGFSADETEALKNPDDFQKGWDYAIMLARTRS